jgi:hypothetical protein
MLFVDEKHHKIIILNESTLISVSHFLSANPKGHPFISMVKRIRLTTSKYLGKII